MVNLVNFDSAVDKHCRAYLVSKGKTYEEIDAVLGAQGAQIMTEATTKYDEAIRKVGRADFTIGRNWHDTKLAVEAWIDANVP